MTLCCEVVSKLKGRTLVTAESCTGGGIGAALTSVAGSSAVFKGGVICYTDWVKENLLSVDPSLLECDGAVSSAVALAMAQGARENMQADIAVSVTGLAGPDADSFGNPVGLVYIGYSDSYKNVCKTCYFTGDREQIREQAVTAALNVILENK